MASGLLLLRLVLGLTMAVHGAQKLFGWFGGGKLSGTTQFMQMLNMRMPKHMAFMAGISEFGGGLLFALGLLTPLAALAIGVVMGTAIITAHWSKGFFNTDGGYEFNLLIATAAVAVAAIGPGKWSLGYLLDWTKYDWNHGWKVGLLVGIASIIITGINVTLGRKSAAETTSASN